MKTYLYFGYRDWAINIFKAVSKIEGDQWLLVTEKRMCNKAFIDKIRPNIVFFYGWSWMVSADIVNNYQCLCLHPSPLPKYRGGSPIQNQVMNGEIESAVTIFKMDDGTDTGDILFQKEMPLTGYLPEIFKRIERLGIEGTVQIMEDLNNDYVRGRPQKEELSTYYPRRTPEQSEILPIDFETREADYFYNLVRCSQPPYPEAYIQFDRGRLVIEKVRYEL